MLTKRRLAVHALAVAFVAAGALGAVAAPAQAAPVCYASGQSSPYYIPSCTGKDPNTYGCGSDAVTLDDTTASTGVLVELRYSAKCYAAWTRHTQIGTGPGTGEVRIEGSQNTYSKTLAAYRGEQGWTPMVSFRQVVRSCIFFYSGPVAGWTTNCTGWY